MLAKILIGLVAWIHIVIALAETVFYRSWGFKMFKIRREEMEDKAVAMSNQGCYNGFLVIALLIGLLYPEPSLAMAFALYGLGCVAVAGAWGGVTVGRKILLIQTLPATLGLLALWLGL